MHEFGTKEQLKHVYLHHDVVQTTSLRDMCLRPCCRELKRQLLTEVWLKSLKSYLKKNFKNFLDKIMIDFKMFQNRFFNIDIIIVRNFVKKM